MFFCGVVSPIDAVWCLNPGEFRDMSYYVAVTAQVVGEEV